MLAIPCRAALFAFLAAFASLAQAQDAGSVPESEASSVLLSSAEKLGMVRGVQRTWKSINRIAYEASGDLSVPSSSGDWSDYRIGESRVEMSYVENAMRAEMTRANADGTPEKQIAVVKGEHAWNESQPGMFASSASNPDFRRWVILTTPHGAVRAALEAEAEASSSVAIKPDADGSSISFSSAEGPLTIYIGPDGLPSQIEIGIEHPTLGSTTVVTELTDYKDWELLDVLFPQRIRQRIGDHVTLDLTITDFATNPYVIFPLPEPLRGS